MHHVYGCRSSSQLATRLSSPIHRSHIESKPPNHRRQLLMEPSRDALGRRCPNHCTRMVPRQRTRPWPCRRPFWKRITKREAANNISMPAGTYGNFPGENGRVNYSEGLMVGYRYYTTRRIPTLFPFGHGLTYTSFSYADLYTSSLSTSNILELPSTLHLSLNVTNTGTYTAHETVQLYVSPPPATVVFRHPLELQGFQKVRGLKPEETRKVLSTLDRYAVSYYDDARKEWVAEAGEDRVAIRARWRI